MSEMKTVAQVVENLIRVNGVMFDIREECAGWHICRALGANGGGMSVVEFREWWTKTKTENGLNEMVPPHRISGEVCCDLCEGTGREEIVSFETRSGTMSVDCGLCEGFGWIEGGQ